MKARYTANVLFVTLMVLSGLATFLLLQRGDWADMEKITQESYRQALTHKFALFNYLQQEQNTRCQTEKTETISDTLGIQRYAFHCYVLPLFLQPVRDKFVEVERLEDWLDLATYRNVITEIRTLDDLPASSEQNPQIVLTLQDIDGRLKRDFYGVVIAPHYFNFTDKKIYGTIFSLHSGNDPNRRNLSFKRSLITQLELRYNIWRALPHSRYRDDNETD